MTIKVLPHQDRYVAIPVGPPSEYIVTKNGRVIRKAFALGAKEAFELLEPNGIEQLYIRVNE